MDHHQRIQGGPSLSIQVGTSLLDPGFVIMGGFRLGDHGRIQAGSSWEDPGRVIMIILVRKVVFLM